MNTLYNAVTGAATAAKEAVVGKDEKQEQAEKSGIEPSSSSEPGKDSEPYDKGNLPTPLASPTAAAHTDPAPVSPKIDSVAEEGTKETNADTSGPSVGNAKLVPDPDAPNPPQTEAVTTTTANTVPSPAQAEEEIKKDVAKELEKEKSDAKKPAEVKRNDFAAPGTPQIKKASDAVARNDSPAGSTSSLKKRLSVRIKEKLHIGSSHKKDKPTAS